MTTVEIRPGSFFNQRVETLRSKSKDLEKKVDLLSWIRVGLFVAFIVLFVFLANAREMQWMLLSLVGFVPVFGWLVREHNRAKFTLQQIQYLEVINNNELMRLEGNLSGLDDGLEFLDPKHAYAPDLDLFGSNSLFQLIVRSKLSGTRLRIRDWLMEKAENETILERQEAVQELQSDPVWRQNLTAFGYHGDSQEKKYQNVVVSLIQWIDSNLGLLDNLHWKILRLLMPLLSLVLCVGIGILGWPHQWIYVPILVNGVLLSFIFKPLMEATKEFGNISTFLRGYENVILEIEKKEFASPLLVRNHDKLKSDRTSASQSIKSLRRILMFLLNRANILYLPFNLLFLLDINWLLMAVRWKKQYIHQVESWFEAVHEIDALNDLASYAFANPEYTFPVISEESHHLSTHDLGHPLIKTDQRVLNHFELCDQGKLGLVTGSNMSGKSTFLRTVGVNFVMAQLGAPVCASHFEFAPVQIFTSMRTQDNLEENVSSFYAELKRLKQLLNLLSDKEPIFYMLDEILKGTNSEDRHQGALSLIQQLINENCRGLISTHDIHLSALAKDEGKIQNMSFNSSIIEDEIIFDYKLSLAPCKSFNASKLMEKMGIIKK